MDNNYTVYVGGDEVNDYYLTEERAKHLAIDFIEDGYDDVVIMDITNDKNYQLIDNVWKYTFTADEWKKEEEV